MAGKIAILVFGSVFGVALAVAAGIECAAIRSGP